MARKDCRELFVTYMCDLMNTAFSYPNIENTLMELVTSRENELTHYLGSLSQVMPDVSADTVTAATNELLLFAQNRHGYVYSFLQNDYAVFTPYMLNITGDSHIQTSVNSIASIEYKQIPQYSTSSENSLFSGIYYADCHLTLSARADEGHEFEYWDVGGKHYEEDTLVLTPEILSQLLGSDSMAAQATNGQLPQLNITVVCRDKKDSPVVISNIRAKDDNDEVTLYNPSEHEITLDGIYISDDSSNLKKTKIPNIVLEGGKGYILYGSKNVLSRSLGSARLGFNLRKGETLYLSDENGNIIEQILIPDLARADTSYIRNPYTGAFRECE